MPNLKIATYNIHKGFSQFNRRVVMHELREKLRELDADIVFLQEVQGEHAHHAQRHAAYPEGPQYEFLADEVWGYHAYGMNAVYEAGHHGNAILSRYPILQTRNRDVSAHRFEQRGLLHCEIDFKGQSVHSFCAHFGLFAKGRRTQMNALIEHVRGEVDPSAPLVIAGDFNDWRDQLSQEFASELGVQDVFHIGHGKLARSFPSAFPMFKLDRIYVRGFAVDHCQVYGGRSLSDHAALLAELRKI
ncbi:MAG: endonuclease/exonuclease/phosphatase family protein [Gallionella sp.]|nr:endonuclease/exonuclease/phosphatase family protein [Gallionella sp.]